MAFPYQLAVHVQRHELTRAKPSVDKVAVGGATRRGQVVHGVHGGSSPSASKTYCQATLPSARAKACTPNRTCCWLPPRRAGGLPGKSFAGPATGPSPMGASPICQVTKMRSPHTIGVDVPSPGRRDFQAMLC